MKTYNGFTLVEMLIGMAILGVLMLAFTQVFGGSLRASSEINARNELLNEGQIAQQLISSRLQNAFYIYTGTSPAPNPMTLSANSVTTRNTVRSGAGQNWNPNSDPFVAMLLPPTITGQCPTNVGATGDERACFTFYAYYPVHRGTFISLHSQTPSAVPGADPNNENVWMLMEYRASIFDGVNRSSSVTNCTSTPRTGPGQLSCPPLPGTTFGAAYTNNTARMLVDYVQPTAGANAPAYTMFRSCNPSVNTVQPNCPAGTTSTSPRSVEFSLRLLKNRVGKPLMAPAGATALSTRIYPRN